jgi:acyl carrier protein phosphodiesterase
MNFLAHILLSGNNKEIQIGNFIGDIVKGNKYNNYPKQIKKGILLHRKIDYYTDNNKIVKQSIARLKPKYGRYSAVVTDIFYDYFLIKNWDKYSNVSLDTFIKQFHINVLQHYLIIPAKAKKISISIIANRWFHRYKTKDGIKEVLDKMAKYRNIPDESSFAISVLSEYENEFNNEFNDFFKEITMFLDCASIVENTK